MNIVLKKKRALIKAIKRSSLEDVKRILDYKKIDANSKITLLHQDIEDGLVKVKSYPLVIAVAYSTLEIVKEIVSRGAIFNLSDEYDWTALRLAASDEKSIDKLSYCLEQGADPNFNIEGYTPLNTAIFENNIEGIKILLKYGATIDKIATNGHRPIEVSSWRGQTDILKIFLEHNPKVDTRIIKGCIKRASDCNRYDAVMFLSEFSKDKERFNHSMLLSAIKKDDIEMVKKALENIVDINYRRGFEGTPISLAIENHRLEIVKLLLEKGAKILIHGDDRSHRNLYFAIESGNEELISLVLKFIDINEKNSEGETTLRLAARHSVHNRTEYTQRCLELGADVNLKDNKGISPLEFAKERVRWGYKNVYELMLTYDKK